MDQKAKMAG